MVNWTMEILPFILLQNSDISSENERISFFSFSWRKTFRCFSSIRILLNYGANPFVENRFGISSWNSMTKLDETNQLKILELFFEFHFQPPIDLIFDSIEENFSKIFDLLLSHWYEDLKIDSLSLSRLLRTALRSSNTVKQWRINRSACFSLSFFSIISKVSLQ